MKKPTIVFRHFSGSGPLSIYWHDGPYGDALEARVASAPVSAAMMPLRLERVTTPKPLRAPKARETSDLLRVHVTLG